MARKTFLLVSTSRELRCQCPMVTPASPGGNGCAQVDAVAKLVMSDSIGTSLLTIASCIGYERRYWDACAEWCTQLAASSGRIGVMSARGLMCLPKVQGSRSIAGQGRASQQKRCADVRDEVNRVEPHCLR